MTAAMRDVYVVGKMGAYHCPTVKKVDEHLSGLLIRLREAAPRPEVARRLRSDVDILLDRRVALMLVAL